MRCPKCDNQKTDCRDSRPRSKGESVYRRRVCPACDFRFSTIEVQMVSAVNRTLMEDRVASHARTLVEGLIKDLRQLSSESVDIVRVTRTEPPAKQADTTADGVKRRLLAR